MFGERCCLCGGKLVNGRCQDCGLNNKRNGDEHYRLNKSKTEQPREYNSESMSSEEDIVRQKKASRQQTEKKKAAAANDYQSTQYEPGVKSVISPIKKIAKPGDKGKMIGIIAAIAIALIGVAPGIFSSVKEKSLSSMEQEYDPYEYALRELSETGEHFEVELEPGDYQAGVHIPEGAYEVTLTEGSGNVHIEDDANGIYVSKYFGENSENGETTEWSDVRLYEGGRVQISGNIRVNLVTENGQNDQMVSVENPLKDSVLVRKGEELEAGKDFLAGVYDLHAASGWSNVAYVVPLNTDYKDEELNSYQGSQWLSAEDLDATYRNLVLTEGTTISPSDGDVELKPSALIMENYESYYERY